MKVAIFVPADQNNLNYFKMFEKSLRKFHTEKEVDLILVGEEDIKKYNDPAFFYRAKPLVGLSLLDKYDCVIGADADQIVTGKLNAIWEADYDVAVVNNSNPREFESYPYQFLNIHPLAYVNCGLVAMKSKAFVQFWLNMCYSIFFEAWQMKEQDVLNVLINSNNFKVLYLDSMDSFYGLASKGYWQYIAKSANSLVLPKNADGTTQWPDRDKQIKVIHWAGGNDPSKMNFDIRFQPDVAAYLKELTS